MQTKTNTTMINPSSTHKQVVLPRHTPKRIYTIDEFISAFDIEQLKIVGKRVFADGECIGAISRTGYDPNGNVIKVYEWEYTDENGIEHHYVTLKRHNE